VQPAILARRIHPNLAEKTKIFQNDPPSDWGNRPIYQRKSSLILPIFLLPHTTARG
jgi:hypothetical protein